MQTRRRRGGFAIAKLLLAVPAITVLRLRGEEIGFRLEGFLEKRSQLVQLRTQLVKDGHTRFMLAETELMTLRIHCGRTHEQGAAKPVLNEGAFFE